MTLTIFSAAAMAQVVPGRYIVFYKTPEAATKGKLQTAALLETTRQTIVKSANQMRTTLRGRGQLRYAFEKNGLQGYVGTLKDAELKALRADPNVALVEQDRKVKKTATQITPANWGLDRIDQLSLPLNNRYSYNNTGNGVRAYVVDTGLLASHTEFTGRVLPGINFAANSSTDPTIDRNNTNDCDGHGTHVTGILGGTQYGVAKKVKITPVRVLDCTGYGVSSDVVAAVQWIVDQNAKPAVINMSIGGIASPAIDAAVTNAVAKGYTVVAAAGNDGVDACLDSPGRVPTAITVVATDASDTRANFSNVGPCVDIFAPGFGIVSAHHTGSTSAVSMDGTSMAAPHVAGIAALILESKPSASPSEVTALIKAQAGKSVNNPGPNSPNLLALSPAPSQLQVGTFHFLPVYQNNEQKMDVAITVLDEGNNPVPNVVVAVIWTVGESKQDAGCTTDRAGSCTINGPALYQPNRSVRGSLRGLYPPNSNYIKYEPTGGPLSFFYAGS